jgi:hypothetical protein
VEEGVPPPVNRANAPCLLASNISNDDDDDRKLPASTGQAHQASSFLGSDDSTQSTRSAVPSPVSSPVARKRQNNDDDDSWCTESGARKPRRSQRLKCPNTFFDPGAGEPDSLWVDHGKKPTGTVEFFTNMLVDNQPFPGPMSPLSVLHGNGTGGVGSTRPVDGNKETVVLQSGGDTTTTLHFPSGQAMHYVANMNQAWVVEKLCETTFRFLNEKLWMRRIKEHVKSAIVDIAMHTPQIIDMAFDEQHYAASRNAALKAVAECINAKDLEEALAETIWNAFAVENVKARTIDNIMNNRMRDVNLPRNDDTDDWDDSDDSNDE